MSLVFLLAFCLLLSGCTAANATPTPAPTATPVPVDPEFVDTLDLTFAKECTGYDLEEVCDKLDIGEKSLTYGYAGEYNFVQKTLYKDIEFTKRLYVDIKNGLMCGGGYEGRFPKDKVEEFVEMLSAIVEDMTAAYGEPTTYPGGARPVIEVIRDPSDFLKRIGRNAIEEWTVAATEEYPYNDSVVLCLETMEHYGDYIKVWLYYQINADWWYGNMRPQS